MADREVEVAKPATSALRRPANKLSTPSRVMAYALGIAGLGAGGVAVFVTHVEAGPVALLAVGLIFMIVALSGRLPTRLRVGDNEAEWQEFAGDIIETALDSATPSARAELVPQLGELAEVAPRAAAPALSGIAYDATVASMIANAANKTPDVQRVKIGVRHDVGEFDFAIEATGNRVILVEVKTAPGLSSTQLFAILAKVKSYKDAYPDRKVGLLLISRHRLHASVRTYFVQDPDAACIVVRGYGDEDDVIGSINGLLSGLRS